MVNVNADGSYIDNYCEIRVSDLLYNLIFLFLKKINNPTYIADRDNQCIGMKQN